MSKVSIIIPIYNVKKYMMDTVGSALNQTESDIEIILVDDGSTDGSGQMCDMLASHDERIVVIHKENGGLSSARNAGVSVSTSEYVMFLDGDDYLRENAVERLLSVVKKYPCDFIQFRYVEVEEGEKPLKGIFDNEIYQAHTVNQLFENLYKLGGVGASACTKFMRRELAEQVPFVPIRHEDEVWCTQAFRKDLTVTYISDELYYYVMRDGSIIHSKFSMSKLDIFKVIEARLKTIDDLKLHEYREFEYRRMFFSILRLYTEVVRERDLVDAKILIKEKFIMHMNQIKKYANITGKYRALLTLMSIRFEFVYLYSWFQR